MEVAFGVLNLTPAVFWSMTLIEFRAIEGGKRLTRPDWVEPLSREELEELDKKFLDKYG